MASAGLPLEVIDHTCHHAHRCNELVTKSENWNGKPRVACVGGQYSSSKPPVGILPWTCRSEGKRPSRLTGGKATLTNGLLLGRSEDTQIGQINTSEKLHYLSDANRLVQVSVIVIISATLQMPDDTQRVTKSSILM